MVIAVGDVHGCIEELDELLKTIHYNKSQMRLVFLGDLVHRGPDSLGCVRRVQEINADCIKGNHEDKLLRWRKHEQKRLEAGKINPMKSISAPEKIANESLSEDDLKWMSHLPVKLDLGLNWWAVHAGAEPRYTLEKQNASQIMRVRYVDEKGVGKALNPDKSQPAGAEYWDMQWKGPESLIYGHCVHDLKHPRFVHNGEVHCVGIDTGCCFGGHLTAAFLKNSVVLSDAETVKYNSYSVEIVQVKAKQKYYAGHGDE